MGLCLGESQAARGDHQSWLEGWLPDSGLGLRRELRGLPGPGAKGRETADGTRRPCSMLCLSALVSLHFGLVSPLRASKCGHVGLVSPRLGEALSSGGPPGKRGH